MRFFSIHEDWLKNLIKKSNFFSPRNEEQGPHEREKIYLFWHFWIKIKKRFDLTEKIRLYKFYINFFFCEQKEGEAGKLK